MSVLASVVKYCRSEKAIHGSKHQNTNVTWYINQNTVFAHCMPCAFTRKHLSEAGLIRSGNCHRWVTKQSKHLMEPKLNQKQKEFNSRHGNHSLGLLDRVGDLSRFWLSRLSRSRGVGVKLPFIILLKLDMSSLDCLSNASFKDRLRS